MEKDIVTWEIELDLPDVYVEVEASRFASDHKLLELAIEEMTAKTFIYKKRILEKN